MGAKQASILTLTLWGWCPPKALLLPVLLIHMLSQRLALGGLSLQKPSAWGEQAGPSRSSGLNFLRAWGGGGGQNVQATGMQGTTQMLFRQLGTAYRHSWTFIWGGKIWPQAGKSGRR